MPLRSPSALYFQAWVAWLSFFFFFCHRHCQENNLSQVTLAKWIISSTCGTHFLWGIFPSHSFSLPLLWSFEKKKKKDQKTCWFLIAFFGTSSVSQICKCLEFSKETNLKELCSTFLLFSVVAAPHLPSEAWNDPMGFYLPQLINKCWLRWFLTIKMKIKLESQFSCVAWIIFLQKGDGSLSLKQGLGEKSPWKDKNGKRDDVFPLKTLNFGECV